MSQSKTEDDVAPLLVCAITPPPSKKRDTPIVCMTDVWDFSISTDHPVYDKLYMESMDYESMNENNVKVKKEDSIIQTPGPSHSRLNIPPNAPISCKPERQRSGPSPPFLEGLTQDAIDNSLRNFREQQAFQ